jgi:hypothetical protein
LEDFGLSREQLVEEYDDVLQRFGFEQPRKLWEQRHRT